MCAGAGRAPGAWARRPGLARKNRRGHFGTKCPKVQIPAKEQAGTGRRVQAPYGKARGEAGGGKGQAGKAETPKETRPRQTGGRGPWGLRPRLCAWEDLRGGAGKCRHRGGPSPASFWASPRSARAPASWGGAREHPARAVRRAEARYGKAAADYQFYTAAQEHPELSKMPCPATGRNGGSASSTKRAKEATCQGPWPLKRPPPPPKAVGPGGGLCEAASPGRAPGPGLCPAHSVYAVLFVRIGFARQRRGRGCWGYHLPVPGRGNPGGGGGYLNLEAEPKTILIPTPAPTTMTSTILIWMKSNTIPMC